MVPIQVVAYPTPVGDYALWLGRESEAAPLDLWLKDSLGKTLATFNPARIVKLEPGGDLMEAIIRSMEGKVNVAFDVELDLGA